MIAAHHHCPSMEMPPRCFSPQNLPVFFVLLIDCYNVCVCVHGSTHARTTAISRQLFNGGAALTHRRNQTRRVFYGLVNEQRRCETCVSVRLSGGGGGGSGPIGLYSPPPLCLPPSLTPSHPPPFVWMLEHSPESHAGRAGISVQISRDSPISWRP